MSGTVDCDRRTTVNPIECAAQPRTHASMSAKAISIGQSGEGHLPTLATKGAVLWACTEFWAQTVEEHNREKLLF